MVSSEAGQAREVDLQTQTREAGGDTRSNDLVATGEDGLRRAEDIYEATSASSVDVSSSSARPEELTPDRTIPGGKIALVHQNSPFQYPRESMTDDERRAFIERIRPAALSVYASYNVDAFKDSYRVNETNGLNDEVVEKSSTATRSARRRLKSRG